MNFFVLPLLLVALQGYLAAPPPHNRVIVDHAPPAQWARPHGISMLLDEGDRNYIGHEVSDPDVGKNGITALKDPELRACFLYKYMKPLVIPRRQRQFYARTKIATVALTTADKTRFRQSVGPSVSKLCNEVKAYWLDEFMFFQYMTNQLHPRNAPPPIRTSDPEEPTEDLSPPLMFPSPPPLKSGPAIKTPPPLPPRHQDVKALPVLTPVDKQLPIKIPPPIIHRLPVKAPPPLTHSNEESIKVPPPVHALSMKAPPPLPALAMKAPPPLD